MKNIFLSAAVFFTFLSVSLGQITQWEADSIVLQYMFEEVEEHTIHAKDTIQMDFSITTTQGELLEIDYPCWVYFVDYIQEINSNHCLVVKESNGSLFKI